MLSIIIVNYRSASLITSCLQTVYEFNKELPFEVIVVDNQSGDNSKERITGSFPKVHWIDMRYNAGFARANNAGMKAGKGEAFLLLNPDTLAVDNAIEQCYDQLMKSLFIAAGVQLLNEDRSFQTSGNFFVKGGLNHLLPIPYWGDLIRWIGYRTKHRVPGVEAPKAVEEIDWINGAFMMVKRSAVEKAGFMDEDFFLYSEEIEWCSRLKKAGPLCIFGNLHMIHLQGESINKDQQSDEKGYRNLYDKKGLQFIISLHVRIRKQYGVFWFLFLLLNFTWGIFVFAIGSFFHRLFKGQNPFGEREKIAAYTKNVLQLWSLTPTILKNKPHFYKMF